MLKTHTALRCLLFEWPVTTLLGDLYRFTDCREHGSNAHWIADHVVETVRNWITAGIVTKRTGLKALALLRFASTLNPMPEWTRCSEVIDLIDRCHKNPN